MIPAKTTQTRRGRKTALGLAWPTLFASNARTGYALIAMGCHGTEKNLTSFFQITLRRANLILSPQKKICYRKIDFLIDIPGFVGIDFEHHCLLTDPVMLPDEVLTCKNVQARILLIDRRQVLGLDQHGRVMVDGAAGLVIEAGLQARHGEERVVGGVVSQETLDGTRDRFRLEQRIRAVGLQIKIRRHL